MLIEDTPVPLAALPLAAFRAHLRMGTGFADESLQDALLEMHLRAAMAAIEARTSKILIARAFRWTVTEWREAASEPLPVAPVSEIASLHLVDRAGTITAVPSERWHLARATQPQTLVATQGTLPVIAQHGRAEVTLTAGFGATWDTVPGDLAQAVLMLAAHFYEFRHSAEGRGVNIPTDIAALIAPHCQVRIGFGGAS